MLWRSDPNQGTLRLQRDARACFPGSPKNPYGSFAPGFGTRTRAMNRTTVFSKTGKGLLEIKNKSNRLSKDQFRVLNLVDGKATLDDLVDKGRITEVELRKVLNMLSDGCFIKEFTNPA